MSITATLVALVVAALSILTAPLAAKAQSTAKSARIGVLLGGSQGDINPTAPFRQGLRDRGWVEGQNVSLEYRWAEGRLDRFPALALELAAMKVDVIIAPGTAAAQGARKATTTIPIVIVTAGNPVGDGLIESFARPVGNLTGLSMSVDQNLGGKLIELLKEAVPSISRVAVLRNPQTAPHTAMMGATEAAARTLRIELHPVDVRSPSEIEGAFAAMTRVRADGLVVMSDPTFVVSRARIVELARKGRLPAIYADEYMSEAGGLFSYGPSVHDLWRRAAGYVDRILRGARPADLPVEVPAKLDLIVNLKAAKSLGLTVPPSLLLRAERTIK